MKSCKGCYLYFAASDELNRNNYSKQSVTELFENYNFFLRDSIIKRNDYDSHDIKTDLKNQFEFINRIQEINNETITLIINHLLVSELKVLDYLKSDKYRSIAVNKFMTVVIP